MVARHLNEVAPGEGLVPATESNLLGGGPCARHPTNWLGLIPTPGLNPLTQSDETHWECESGNWRHRSNWRMG
jgi:hypothetical protein